MLQLFPLSLIETTFSWYSFPPQNSIQTWTNIERCFRYRFNWLQPEVTTVDLMKLRKQVDESVANLIEEFNKTA